MNLRSYCVLAACLMLPACASTGTGTPYDTAQREGWNHYGSQTKDVGPYVALGALQEASGILPEETLQFAIAQALSDRCAMIPVNQEAIRWGQVPSFEWLTSTSERQFYNEDPGTNYAQARYLCYYLQQQGMLRRLYREFKQNQKDDPTGYETLKDVLGETDMNAFKKKWERFVLDLTFP